MRLICPNCDAQYEVPPEVMPREGRDVQCSNCGQTWFQEHPDHPQEAAVSQVSGALEDEEVVAVTPATPQEQFIAPKPAPKPKEETQPDADAAPEVDDTGDEDDLSSPGPKRRELDPAVADVLRAEAELEAQARRNETTGVESQPDLGLTETPDDESRRAREAQERMAQMRGETPDADEADEEELLAASPAVLASRRDLLPDIEEINSTLRSNNDRSATADPGQTAQIEHQERRSSRLGFSLTVALVATLALVYVFSPKLIELMPQAEPMLSAYASMIDGWRAWLDAQVESALNWLDAAALSSSQ